VINKYIYANVIGIYPNFVVKSLHCREHG